MIGLAFHSVFSRINFVWNTNLLFCWLVKWILASYSERWLQVCLHWSQRELVTELLYLCYLNTLYILSRIILDCLNMFLTYLGLHYMLMCMVPSAGQLMSLVRSGGFCFLPEKKISWKQIPLFFQMTYLVLIWK